MYPTTETQTDANRTETHRKTRSKIKCTGPRRKYRATDPEHHRVPGECKFPHVQEVKYKCPGCAKHYDFSHPAHTYEPGECKAVEEDTRLRGQPRRGRHPRNPAVPVAAAPTSGMQAQDLDARDLGEDDERQAQLDADAERCQEEMY